MGRHVYLHCRVAAGLLVCPFPLSEKDLPATVRTGLAVLVLMLSALPHGLLAKGDSGWPAFLGPHANGTSDETGLLDKWPANGPPIIWDKKIGTGYGAPSVRDNLLVLHHRVGDEEIIESLDAVAGKSVWRYA